MINYYDALFFDPAGLKKYSDFVLKHAKEGRLIELASGTGDMLNLLQNTMMVTGVDIDPAMIEATKVKYPDLKATLVVGDFRNYNDGSRYDTAICVGDSTNYVNDAQELEALVDTLTTLSNTVIVDCHHPHRLKEFADDYYEEGSTDTFDYAYQIEVEGDHLVHIINFLDGTFDTIYQWVFDPKLLISLFEAKGYYVQAFTDYETKGVLPEGEKVVMVARK